MAVDLKKNGESIIQSWKEVSNPSSENNWALYGYEGQTSVLKLLEKGDDFDELIDSLSAAKIMYAYCRVTDPNTNLPKYIFINWQGEAAPELNKGRCANHVRDIARLLRGAHVTVNARSEDDVVYEDLLKQVAKASGSNYSVHKEVAKAEPEAGPVGSVYKKVRPQADIRIKDRDKFWETAEKDEQHRVAEEKVKAKEARGKLEKERREREAEEAKKRDALVEQRAQGVAMQRRAERLSQSNDGGSAKQAWEQEQRSQQSEEAERGQRSEKLRKERAAEAASLVKDRSNNPREMFKQRERAFSQEDQPPKGPPPPRKKMVELPKKQVEAPPSPPPAVHRAPPALPPDRKRSPSPPPDRRRSPSPPPDRRSPSPPPDRRRSPSPPPDRRRSPSPPVEPRGDSPPPLPPGGPRSTSPPRKNPVMQGLPPRPDSDDEEEEDADWDTPTHEDENKAAPPPAPATYEEDVYDDSMATPQEYEQDVYDDTMVTPQQQDSMVQSKPPGPAGNEGVAAVALYDYQATDEDELTFDPGDLITDIEKVDEGWWIGTGPDGARGMFPSNYVEES